MAVTLTAECLGKLALSPHSVCRGLLGTPSAKGEEEAGRAGGAELLWAPPGAAQALPQGSRYQCGPPWEGCHLDSWGREGRLPAAGPLSFINVLVLFCCLGD